MDYEYTDALLGEWSSVRLARDLTKPRPGSSIAVVDRTNALLPSFTQQRLWFTSQMEGASEAYHISFGVRLRGVLDEAALAQALTRLVDRHEALRTTLYVVAGQLFQRINPTDFSLQHADVSGLDDPGAALRAQMRETFGAPFDLERGPLFRARLVRQSPDDHVLLLAMHHIVSDGWSMGVLLRELKVLYNAYSRGGSDALAPLPLQFADYAAWQRQWLSGDVVLDQSAYWRRTLAGAPALIKLPTDRARPAHQDFKGGTLPVCLDAALTRRLKETSRRYELTMFMTLIAGWAVVLSRLAAQEDIVIGFASANRTRVELEGIVGAFVNTLALRINLAGNPTVEELLLRVKQAALDGQAHQDLPFDQVVDVVNPIRSRSHTALFQVMVNWDNLAIDELDLRGLRVSRVQREDMSARFDLTLSLEASGDHIVGTLNYAAALFDAATIERYVGYLEAALQVITGDPRQLAMAAPLLSDGELTTLLLDRNATKTSYPKDRCVHELFEDRATRSADAIALAFQDFALSYAELNARSNRLAHYLRELGVGPDRRVGICFERSVEMVIALLAVTKAGGAFVPLDPVYPPERLGYMLRDCAATVVLTHTIAKANLLRAAAHVRTFDPAVIDLDTDAAAWAACPGIDLRRTATGLKPRHLAYVIYTSGSTGQPKGVMVEQQGLVNLIVAKSAEFGLGEGSRTLLFLVSFGFDIHSFVILGSLVSGGTLELSAPDVDVDEIGIRECIVRRGITHLFIVPSFLTVLTEDTTLDGVDVLGTGGEAVTWDLVDRWTRGRRFVNAYGPAEATITSATCDFGSQRHREIAAPPIGRPIANVRLYVLDAWHNPVPQGAAGELYIGGPGVARGYANRPALTAERFVANPFGSGERLYRTGDLARYLPDGTIEFIGRADLQVKIRGFRIELGEIEAQLAAHPDVREAAVIAREDTPGDTRLVAYYVAHDPSVSAEDLSSHLAARLPEHMVPPAYVRLERLPLTPNGKLDRAALPAPEPDAYGHEDYESPRGQVEQTLAAIWSEVLNVPRVGRDDDFFALGGHSLLAIRALDRMRTAGLVADIDTFFDKPVLAVMAAAVTVAGDASVIAPMRRDQPLAPSFAQQRVWFLSQMEGVGDAYHMSFSARLTGPLDTAALSEALTRLVARHEALRTTFYTVDGELFQRINAPDFSLRCDDVGSREPDDDLVRRRIEEELTAPFDLDKGPLFRGRLFRLAPHDHILILTMHHIVFDGWSMGVLLRDLQALYRACSRREPDGLTPLPIQYADYAAWQRQWLSGTVLSEQSAYWQRTLAGAPAAIELPTDRPRPAQQDFAGRTIPVVFDARLTASLKELSRRHNVTLFMTVLAGWVMVLSRLANQDEVVVGVPSANRPRAELERLVGFFINTLALRVAVDHLASIRKWLQDVKSIVLDAQAHPDLPFEQIVDLLKPIRSLSQTPVFQVAMVWQSDDNQALNLPGVDVQPLVRREFPAKFDLTLALRESHGEIVGSLNYATALFDAATVERFVEFLKIALEAIGADQEQPVAAISLLRPAERQQLLAEWNRADVAYPQERCLHEQFEAQAARDPQAIALVAESETVSYGELNARANQLAQHLRDLGASVDAPVGLCIERSIDMIVGLLAILKAGGGYVPLDAAYPPERLAYMLQDSAPRVVLTHAATRSALATAVARVPALTTTVVDLTDDAASWAARDTGNLSRAHTGVTPQHLAYVIYTSGSTGQPKGVMVPHAAVARLFAATEAWVQADAQDVWTLFHSVAFDFSVWEIWGALRSGGRLVIVPAAMTRAPEELYDRLCDVGVTILNQTPSAFGGLLRAQARSERAHQLRLVIFGGEALSPAMLAPWYDRAANAATRLVNMYGITETTVHVTAYPLSAADVTASRNPIGQPIADLQVYVLDRWGHLAPQGVTGELYVGGAGLARGYRDRPGLTATRFVANPFSSGARLYRTGDLGRYLPDGTLEYLGRNDWQVKIRGFRIELGEIEAHLASHPDVREAVVVASEEAAGETRLVAYYTATDRGCGAEELRQHLAAQVPEHMVPAAYVRLEALPLTAHGKLDRAALPAPDADAYARHAFAAPIGEVEQTLAEIWADVLGVGPVGRDDDFFALGGHSLLAIRVLDRMRRAGLQTTIRTLFATPVLADVARAVEVEVVDAHVEVPPNRITVGCTHITPDLLPLIELTQDEIDRIVATVPGGAANIQDVYPLAPLQEGLLYHHVMAQTGDPYLLWSEISFTTRARLTDYVAALNAVIERHDILRTAVLWEGLSEPVQVVWRRAPVAVEDLALDPADGDIAEQLRQRHDPRRYRLDVRQAPMMRLYVAHDPAQQRWVMLWLLHHLIDDATSLRLLHTEIEAALSDMEGVRQ